MGMKKLIFATGNSHKMREIREILEGLPLEILSLKEAGMDCEIEENGDTFRENAWIKARAIGPLPDAIVMADDSGLSVQALQNGPGVRSARFLGTETPYEEKNRYILSALEGLSGRERSAYYTCAIAVLFPDGREFTAEGIMEGEISLDPSGENGFGYDPIFYVPSKKKTAAELSSEEKNALSHRGQALRIAKAEIWRYLEEKK